MDREDGDGGQGLRIGRGWYIGEMGVENGRGWGWVMGGWDGKDSDVDGEWDGSLFG